MWKSILHYDDMSLVPPIVKPSKAKLAKLPREIKLIMSYIDVPIAELLTSDNKSFEASFESTRTTVISCMAQIAAILGSRKDGHNIVKRLGQIYSLALSQMKSNISKSKNDLQYKSSRIESPELARKG